MTIDCPFYVIHEHGSCHGNFIAQEACMSQEFINSFLFAVYLPLFHGRVRKCSIFRADTGCQGNYVCRDEGHDKVDSI